MTCYDETRSADAPSSPRVQRDGDNVREIAENPSAFIGHARPRRHAERDSHDGSKSMEE